MRRGLFALVTLALMGCGGTSQVATPTAATTATVTPAPTANNAATATRGAELAQIATLNAPTATLMARATPGATATPTIREDQSPLAPDSTASIPGAFRVTMLKVQYSDVPTTPPIRTIFVTMRIENIGTTTVQYTPCSFTLRDGSGEDNEAFACNDRTEPQGPFLLNGGGSRVENVKFNYYKDRGLRSVRFVPASPADTLLVFGIK